MIRPRSIALAFILAVAATAATAGPDAAPRIHAARLDAPPTLDAFVQAMERDLRPRTPMRRVRGFRNRFPRDDEAVSQRTEAWVGRDADTLYVVFMAWSDDPSAIRSHRVARDRIYEDDDSVAVQLDTFRDFRRAYGLQANPAGTRQDGFWVEGSGWSLDPDFDYRIESARTSRGYIVKYAIPFRALAYPAGADEWGLMLMRIVGSTGEAAFWPRYSRQVQGRMNQAAILRGMADIAPSPRGQVAPYASALDLRTRDGARTDFRTGLDARWRLDRASELALTINPDFGQVESDEPQIAANQRFELFNAEKRPFFADHARYFATPLQWLFTRRIAAPDAGLKASGQHAGLTWAALAVRDDPDDAPTRDLFAGRARYDLRPDLSLGLGLVSLGGAARNTVASLDARWQAGDRWVVEAQAARSRDDGTGASRDGDAGVLRLQGTGATWNYLLDHRRIDAGFEARAGFVPRRGIHDTRQTLGWRHHPARGPLTALGPDLALEYVTDPRGMRLDRGAELALVAEFPRQGLLSVFASPRDERLAPDEFPVLAAPRDYAAGYRGLRAGFSAGPGAFGLRYASGDRIDFVPPAGEAPRQGRFRELSLDASLRPGELLTNDNTLLYSRLARRDGGARVFDTLLVRSKWYWHFAPDWSLRLIGQYRRTRVAAALTRLPADEGANLDLLLAWQPSPQRAWFLGINTDHDAFDDDAGDPFDPRRRHGLRQRARSIYTKFSWSFDFG